ncbi:uncharacterized protein LOC128242082 isoform X1 [Mya arenaria]|uniref:uncharacterized protein LOC128242082 isoform X1 n=1 Tax=Mya arenaria TaxID=6604 RepID=UPI0022E5B450|nr:uncharacterized protein LOC128242082 isoform X1 [Mya arenaria]
MGTWDACLTSRNNKLLYTGVLMSKNLAHVLLVTRVTFLLCALIYQCRAQKSSPSPPPPIPVSNPPANNQVCLIVPQDVEDCYLNFQGKPINDKAAQVNCLQKLLWNFTPDNNLTQSDISYFRALLGDQASAMAAGGPGGSLIGQPPSGRRTRKEYRLLSVTERQRFHAALNKLYEEGVIAAFARLHARAARSHHNGASFLPWHRVFIIMFEEALRRVDPSVALPFWDCTIDDEMDNPVNSVLWTPEYFGSGTGEVIDGPAAGWVTNQGNLERNYGRRSRLISKRQIRSLLRRCNLRNISQPFASRRYDFEYFHGGPHLWIGGDMAFPATAAYDPVFYMYHAFVDYVWELFRRRQLRQCRVDPSNDYPDIPLGDSHAAQSPMTGFEWLINRDGLQHEWIDHWYSYESTPSCPNCCDGCSFPPPINCNRRRRVCMARSRRNFAFGPRSENTRTKDIFAQAKLDPREVESLEVQLPPRNRGAEFQGPQGDGRTLFTAIADAFESVRNETGESARNLISQNDQRSPRFDPRRPDTVLPDARNAGSPRMRADTSIDRRGRFDRNRADSRLDTRRPRLDTRRLPYTGFDRRMDSRLDSRGSRFDTVSSRRDSIPPGGDRRPPTDGGRDSRPGQFDPGMDRPGPRVDSMAPFSRREPPLERVGAPEPPGFRRDSIPPRDLSDRRASDRRTFSESVVDLTQVSPTKSSPRNRGRTFDAPT